MFCAYCIAQQRSWNYIFFITVFLAILLFLIFWAGNITIIYYLQQAVGLKGLQSCLNRYLFFENIILSTLRCGSSKSEVFHTLDMYLKYVSIYHMIGQMVMVLFNLDGLYITIVLCKRKFDAFGVNNGCPTFDTGTFDTRHLTI